MQVSESNGCGGSIADRIDDGSVSDLLAKDRQIEPHLI